jgi:hypothetical protein
LEVVDLEVAAFEPTSLPGRVARDEALGVSADERFFATFFKKTSKPSETARREKRAHGPHGEPVWCVRTGRDFDDAEQARRYPAAIIARSEPTVRC